MDISGEAILYLTSEIIDHTNSLIINYESTYIFKHQVKARAKNPNHVDINQTTWKPSKTILEITQDRKQK